MIDGHLNQCITKTQIATNMLLELERSASGHTRNDRYYREYKDKFLSHFKLQRESAAHGTLLRDLTNMVSQTGNQPHVQFQHNVNQAVSNLGKAGFTGINPLQLAKILNLQSSDPALEDMAAACAGFEGASHRIVSFLYNESSETINT